MNALLLLLAAAASAQSFETWAARAERAHKKGEASAAIDYWGNALRLWRPAEGKSRRAKALGARAALYAETGAHDDALRDLNEALTIEPKNAKLLDKRGVIHMTQGRLTEAVSDFYAAVKNDIGLGPAYLHRAQAYEKQGEKLFASEDFKTACRLGVKEACGQGAAPTSASPAERPKPRVESKTIASEPAAPAPKAAKPDFKPSIPACAAALTACSDRGSALGVCAQKAVPCEDRPRPGCCPRDCLREFLRLTGDEDSSEAEMFRLVFGPNGSCRPPAP